MFNFSKKIGIDLGTANSLVYVSGEGIVLNEPTVVAVAADTQEVLAVGNKAKEMLGRTPESIEAKRPLRDGVIADYDITQAMLRHFIDKVIGTSRLFKPEVMVCVPSGITPVERRAVIDATVGAGAKSAFLIDEPLAAAIGAKIPIGNASGNMIVDLGGGSADAAVISLGGVVVSGSTRIGGTFLDDTIAAFVKRKYSLIIGERMSEDVKLRIGSAVRLKTPLSMDVKGRGVVDGLPKVVTLTSDDITEAMQESLQKVSSMVVDVLERTPPELAADIVDKGILLTGGTAQLQNLDTFLMDLTGVPVYVADDPLYCVVNGTGIALDNLNLYRKSLK